MAVVLVATWQPDTASVLLTVVGSTWTTVPATVTVTRKTASTPETKVRGIIGKSVIGGYLVAVDHEMELNSTVTYTITGYSALGAAVGSASASVDTSGCQAGLWLKVPGRPDLTARADLAPGGVGAMDSATIGGTYQVIGGGSVSVVAHYLGAVPHSQDLTLQALTPVAAASVRTALGSRVLLMQCVGSDDVVSGWRFVSKVSESLLSQVLGGGDGRRFSISTQSVGVPAGQLSGGTWTYAISTATWATYAASKAAHASYFARSQGQ